MFCCSKYKNHPKIHPIKKTNQIYFEDTTNNNFLGFESFIIIFFKFGIY